MDFREVYKNDRFANENGVVLDEVSDSCARAHLVIAKEHLNGLNIAHGALFFLMSDVVMAAISNRNHQPAVTIQADTRFFAPAFEGDLVTAEAVEVFGHRSLCSSRVTITNQNGDLLAVTDGVFYVKHVKKAEAAK